MAYAKKEYENLLAEIAGSGGDTAKMMELLQKLRDDFDEREGELKRYRETGDKDKPQGADREERKIEAEAKADDKADEGERREAYSADYKQKYEDLREEYLKRFFGVDKERDDEERRPEDVDFDDLFD